jgi:hypothetical protein
MTHWLGTLSRDSRDLTMAIRKVDELEPAEAELLRTASAHHDDLTRRPAWRLLRDRWAGLRALNSLYWELAAIGADLRAHDNGETLDGFRHAIGEWSRQSRSYLGAETASTLDAFGERSDEFARSRAVRARACHDHLGLRFWAALHEIIPGDPELDEYLSLALRDQGTTYVVPSVDRFTLLTMRETWPPGAPDTFDELPERIALVPLVEDAMAGLAQIETEARRRCLHRLRPSLPLLRSVVDRLHAESGYPVIISTRDTAQGGEPWFMALPDCASLDAVEALGADPADEALADRAGH